MKLAHRLVVCHLFTHQQQKKRQNHSLAPAIQFTCVASSTFAWPNRNPSPPASLILSANKLIGYLAENNSSFFLFMSLMAPFATPTVPVLHPTPPRVVAVWHEQHECWVVADSSSNSTSTQRRSMSSQEQ
jgi:hypothetical protein